MAGFAKTPPSTRRSGSGDGECERESDAFAAFGAEEQVPLVAGVEEEVAEEGDVLLAVAFDLVDAAFLPPLKGLQAVCTLGDAQGFLSEVAEGQTKAQARVDGLEQVEAGQVPQAVIRVALQHLVVEADRVETDHQIGGGEIGEE